MTVRARPPLRHFKPGILATAVALAMVPALPAMAQQSGEPAGSAAVANQTFTFDIPSTSLAQAITEFSAATGVQVLYTGVQASEVTAPALQGSYTTTQALDRLLDGSGLSYRFTGEASVTLASATGEEGAGPTMLSPIEVTGSASSAFSPIEGYAATHSYTATKTDTPIIDTPASIQVVPEDVMQDQQVTRLKDALKNVSGIQPAGQTGVTTDAFLVRGFRQQSFVYRDGFRTPNPNAVRFFEMNNVDRVEVLKGPSSVLFGRSEPGGVINLVSKRPLREERHSIEQQDGSDQFFETIIDSTGPVGDLDSLQYRLIASYQDADSFRNFVESDATLINPQLAWDVSDMTRLNLSLEYSEQNRTNDFGLPAIGDSVADVPEDRFVGLPGDFVDTEALRAALDGTHQFSDNWILRAKFLYEDFERRDARHRPASFNETTGDYQLEFVANNAFPETLFFTTNLEGHFDTGPVAHTLLLGVDHTESDLPWTFPSNAFSGEGPSTNLFDPVRGPAVQPSDEVVDFGSADDFDKRMGVYWQDQLTFMDDRLHLLVGGRYDDTEALSFGTENENEEYSQRYGLVFKPKPWLAVYGNYSESFSGNPIFSRTRSGELLDPEKGELKEVGTKTELFDGRLNTTVAWFELTKANIPAPDPVDPNFSVAIGEAQSEGVEVDVAGEIAPGWNVIASYTWLDRAEITEDGSLGQEGKRFFNTPEHAGSLWSTYTLQTGALRRLALGAGVFASSDRFGDNDNTFKANGYGRVDAMARYPFSVGGQQLTAQLNIENLFNKDYIESTGNSRLQGNMPGAPLKALFSLKAQF